MPTDRVTGIAGVRPIEPSLSLAAQGTSALREMILNGVLEPNTRLNEVEMSAALGISRAPLREAIRHLASEGLLDIVTHKGAFVASLTADDLRELYEVRIALESHAVRLVAARRTATDLAALRSMLDDAGTAIRRSRGATYADDIEFHRFVVTITGNRQLQEAVAAVDRRTQLTREPSNHAPGRAVEALDEHRRILKALTDRDGDAAADLMTQHLRATLGHVLGVAGSSTVPPPRARRRRDS